MTAAYSVVLIAIENRYVPLPRVTDVATGLPPVRLIAPLALVVVLLWVKGDFAIEKSADRPVSRYGDFLLVLTVALSAAICAAAQQAHSPVHQVSARSGPCGFRAGSVPTRSMIA